MSRARLSKVSTTDLHSELRRRAKGVDKLRRRREALAAQLDAIDAELSGLGVALSGGGRGRGGPRKRPKNEMNLVEALQKLLSGRTMSVTDASEAVQRAGYKTSAENFRTIVNQTLINSGKFKRVSRGQYTSK